MVCCFRMFVRYFFRSPTPAVFAVAAAVAAAVVAAVAKVAAAVAAAVAAVVRISRIIQIPFVCRQVEA